MRTLTCRLVLLIVLTAAAAAPGVRAQSNVVEETLTIAMPQGEIAYPLRHLDRTPNLYYHPVLYFTDTAGATDAEKGHLGQLASAGGWAVLIDLKNLQAGLADEARFPAALDALARAVKERMSEAMGPRLRGMPERDWPITFGGSGAGAVRAVEAAIKYKALGGVRGLMLVSPADKAPSLDKGGAPLVLEDLIPKLSVTPVAFVSPAEDARIHALSKRIIGYSGVEHSLGKALSFVSMYYPIRHRRDPAKAPHSPRPEDLFRPNPSLGH